jgi:uncharacterized protein YjbK
MRRNLYLKYSLFSEASMISSGTVLFDKPKYFEFKDPKLEFEVVENGDKLL